MNSTQLKFCALLITTLAASAESDMGQIEIHDPRLNTLIKPGTELEILASGFRWAEGPLWLEKQQILVFSDVPANVVYSWSEKGRGNTWCFAW